MYGVCVDFIHYMQCMNNDAAITSEHIQDIKTYGGGEQSDWLLSKAQVHRRSEEHKHNMEPRIIKENQLEFRLLNVKQNKVNT